MDRPENHRIISISLLMSCFIVKPIKADQNEKYCIDSEIFHHQAVL